MSNSSEFNEELVEPLPGDDSWASNKFTQIGRAAGCAAAYINRPPDRMLADLQKLLLKEPEWSITAAAIAGLVIGIVARGRR